MPIIDRSYYEAAEQGRQDRRQQQANTLALKLGEQRYQQNALAGQQALEDAKAEKVKRFATEMAHAAQYASQVPAGQTKAFIERNFPTLVETYGPEWQSATDDQVRQELSGVAARYGVQAGIAPDKPKGTSGALYRVAGPDGKPKFATAEEAVGKAPYVDPQGGGGPVNQQLVTRPVGNGMVQDFAWNPRTNQRVPSGAPYRPVTPHTGNVTEGERKAAALGTRLEAALQEISAVETEAPGASRPGFFERGLESMGSEMGANAVRSPERQRADTAQLDALDAALTLATGAAYTREQLQNLRKSYFPQIGDSDAAVAAKAKRFETIVETARIAAGRAEPSIDKAVPRAPQGGGPQPGAVEDGFRFLGGDPADPSSWEPVQ